jgi:two-component system sensor histidine kinase KdpD
MSLVRTVSPPRRPRLLIARLLVPEYRWPAWSGYGAAVLGVALATGAIHLINQAVHLANISLLYLLVVLWLATAFGRGPALLASMLAFLAYDFFFIPPLYLFRVDDPTEWVSLGVLLMTSLVIGQLTALVQKRAREARESQRQIATLYDLAQLIASTHNPRTLQEALVQRVLEVFAPLGVEACALWLPDSNKHPHIQATAATGSRPQAAFTVEQNEQVGQAGWVLRHGTPVGWKLTLNETASPRRYILSYLPLCCQGGVIGVVELVGTPESRRLVPQLALFGGEQQRTDKKASEPDPSSRLLAAFCDQIALALERATLQQQAVHTEALRQSNQLKDALLGSVTHELRTPLASIEAAASSLLSPGVTWSSAEGRELLESITTSARRLNRLVSNLLDLSRLEAGVALPQPDWQFIGDVLAVVLDRLELTGQLHRHHIEVMLPDDLPLVLMDHEQLEQVFTNLLENALKYSPADTVIQIQARVVGPPAELEVRISDQGIGIPASELKAIFDKFYRVQSARLPWARMRTPIGTGLGLAICTTIIRAHGGRIWAESQEGKGATFIFTLPIPAEGPPNPLGLPPTTQPEDSQTPEVKTL